MSYGATAEYAAQRPEPEPLVEDDFDPFAEDEVTDEVQEQLEPKREQPDADDDAWLYECSVTAD